MYYANFHVEFTITFSTRWFENTNTCTRDVEDKRDGSERRAEEKALKMGEHFRFVVFCATESLYIYLWWKKESIRKFICKCSLIYSCIHEAAYTCTAVSEALINLISFSALAFYFHFLGYCFARPGRTHARAFLRWAHSSGNERKRHSRVMGRWGNLFPFVFMARHFPFFKANNKEKLDSFLASIWRPRRVGPGRWVRRAGVQSLFY